MLRLSDVEVRYGAVLALDGISLDVPEGHIVALLGNQRGPCQRQRAHARSAPARFLSG